MNRRKVLVTGAAALGAFALPNLSFANENVETPDVYSASIWGDTKKARIWLRKTKENHLLLGKQMQRQMNFANNGDYHFHWKWVRHDMRGGLITSIEYDHPEAIGVDVIYTSHNLDLA